MNKFFSSFEEVIADENFLAWYLQTDLTKAKLWQNWLTQNPEQQPVVNDAIHYLESIQLAEAVVPNYQVKQAHERLMASIKTTQAPVVHLARNKKFRWIAAAAAVVVLIIGAYQYTATSGANQLKLNTQYGQLAKYKLPDGSGVMLNANSKITLNKNWKQGSNREVWLEGEGFFEVQKTKEKTPFIVHTSGMDILVTGTRFNVVNRGAERNVLLTEGSVTLKLSNGKELKMLPGDFVKLNNRQPEKIKAPEEQILAWKQAKLVFQNTAMKEVAKTINLHYGIEVTLGKGVELKKITGILPNNNLDVLLKALEATMDFTIYRGDKKITISNTQQAL